MSNADFKPFIAPETKMREFTFRAVFVGAILGIVFAASSVYLALKVGMTVSASIPIAVLSITLFRLIGRATILENNIVQTTGSAGESIAFGVATTMPVFLLLGQDMNLMPILWMSLLGGMLGVLMMIPLRQGLIVKEHGKLTYPEGTACADVLIVGEQGGTNAKTVFLGFGIGALYKFLNAGTKIWAEIPNRMLAFFKGASHQRQDGVFGFRNRGIVQVPQCRNQNLGGDSQSHADFFQGSVGIGGSGPGASGRRLYYRPESIGQYDGRRDAGLFDSNSCN